MGRSARHLFLLTFACAFSSCLAEVASRVKLSREATSFHHHMATYAQPLYHSSPHQSTTVHFNSRVSLETTPMSHGTAVQTTEQHQVTATPGHNATTAQAGDNTSAAGQTTARAVPTATPAASNTTTSPVPTTRARRGSTAAATNTSLKHTTASTQVTAAATASKAATTSKAITTQTVKPTTGPEKQTTVTRNPTATAMTSTTTARPVTQTVRPTPAPQPSAIPTGTYTVSDRNRTCIKVVMGLQLIAQNTQKKQMEYVTVNPNVTQTFGSCGMVQSELNLTFSGGFVNFTFVKQAPSYSVSKIESRIPLSSEDVPVWREGTLTFWRGKNKNWTQADVLQATLKYWTLSVLFSAMFYYAAINEKLFTTKLGNSFKCASRQTFTLEKDFQILFVHMQLQAFDIVGDQFGREEECFADRNSKAAPIAVGLSILGLFVIVFATFLISRRKSHRGYERI